MSISINANNLSLFQSKGINKTRQCPKTTDDLNKKNDKSNSSITLKQNNKQSSLMTNLLTQKQSFSEQKRTVLDRTMDPKEKKYKLAEIDKNIQEIEAQIQQLIIQEKQEEVEKQQDKISKKKAEEEKYNQNNDEIRDDIIISASLNELIKFSSSKETIHLLKDSKNRQRVEAEYIKPNDNPNSYNNKKLSQISKSIATIDITVSKKVGDLIKSAEHIRDKTELAAEQLNNKEDKKSDEDIKSSEDINISEDSKVNEDNNKIKEYK